MATAIVMPKAGNSVEECFLSKWNIKVGDTVKKGDIIATAETDKTSVEVEATEGGTVLALFAEEGQLVPVLTPICAVGAPGEDASALAPKGAAPAAAPAPTPAAAPAPARKGPNWEYSSGNAKNAPDRNRCVCCWNRCSPSPSA